METKRAGERVSSTSRCPIDRASERKEAIVTETPFASKLGLRRELKISVAGPGSGGIDTSIWLFRSHGATRAAA